MNTPITSETIRIIRQVFRLTLAEMSAMLGVSTTHLWRLERGMRPLTPEIKAAVKREFELTDEKWAYIKRIYDETDGRSLRRVRVATV